MRMEPYSEMPGKKTGEYPKSQEALRRASYLWNTTAGIVLAFQSVVMLFILMRVCDLETAGIFTIAYANAMLFLNMGEYGMRNYQVSDVEPRFGFKDYLVSRGITTAAMILCAGLWIAWSAVSDGYSTEKTLVLILMCLFKVVDSIEDVFYGNYQQHGRLDLAGKLLTFRLASTLVVFSVAAVTSHSLVVAMAFSTVFTAAFLVVALCCTHRRCHLPTGWGAFSRKSVVNLLSSCLPLFLAAFLIYYIGNAPKYAINTLMTDSDQALYGFIAMPVFVVSLLASFIYTPIIAPVSALWAEGDAAGVMRTFRKQIAWIGVIAGISVLGAWLVGVPVLGWLYNTDLSSYRIELCVLVAGGGFLALATLFMVGVTIIRHQKRLIAGYLAVAFFAFVSSGPVVGAWGIAGASWVYLVFMVLLAMWFAVVFLVGVRSQRS
jgi:O-antigen/teichoic acid export membrane protein